MSTAFATETGYSTGKCPDCGTRIMALTSTAKQIMGSQVVIRCTTKGCASATWGVTCKRIMGKVSEKECGPRCTSATGPNCDCKCGGDNHGSDLR